MELFKYIFGNILVLIFFCFFAFFAEGCLTTESKEYYFKLDKDNSGHGSIKYINIMSDLNDTDASIETDYSLLIDSYLNGNKIDEEITGVKNIKKHLYEEDNQLCGEVTFDFDDFSKLKFYKYRNTGPWCYFIPSFSVNLGISEEKYFSSNGIYGGENVPVIFWEGNQKEFKFTTSLTSPGDQTRALLQLWKEKGEHSND